MKLNLEMKGFVRWIILISSIGFSQCAVLRHVGLIERSWTAPNWPPLSNPSTIQATTTEGITSTTEDLTSTTMASTSMMPEFTTVDIDSTTDNFDSTTIQDEKVSEEDADLPISPITTESPISNPSTFPPIVIPTLPPRTIQIKNNNIGDIISLKMLLNLKLDNELNQNKINVIGLLRNQ